MTAPCGSYGGWKWRAFYMAAAQMQCCVFQRWPVARRIVRLQVQLRGHEKIRRGHFE